MRERYNAVINESTILRYVHALGGTPVDVFALNGIDIYDVDPVLNPSAVPVETIAAGSISHDGIGEYSYIMTSKTTAGIYYDAFKKIVNDGDSETIAYQQTIVNQSIDIGGDLCPYPSQGKIGYTFKNYVVPENCWGTVGTPDDLRYTYLFGIDLKAQNGQEPTNEQIQYVIDSALAEFETYLGIDIRKRIYKTKPDDSLVRGRAVCVNGNLVDYTDEEDPYPFRPNSWRNYGFVQLKHYPVISVERAMLYTITQALLFDLIENKWLRVEKEAGQLYIYPKRENYIYGPPTMAAGGSWLWLRAANQQYPEGFEFDYTTGYLSSDYVPGELREIILKLAAIGMLQWVGDGLLAGFSSSSISLDGLSEAFSSTQSATSAYFGARILSYQNEIKAWLKRCRYKYANIPISFIS